MSVEEEREGEGEGEGEVAACKRAPSLHCTPARAATRRRHADKGA